MKLNHKIFQLVNPKGESVVIEDINNLRILVQGVDFEIPLVPQKEGDPQFCKTVRVHDSCFHGFCLFEKFQHTAPGYLTYDSVHISFFDTVLNTELLVKEVVEPGWLDQAIGNEEIADEEISLLLKMLQKCANKAIELAEKEAEAEPAVVQPDALPETEVSTEEPKNEEPKNEEPKNEEPKNEEPKNEEPKNEEPKNEESKNEEPKNEEPNNEEPKNEEPKNEEPKSEEPKTDEPKSEVDVALELGPKNDELPVVEQPVVAEPVVIEPVVETAPLVENQTATQLEENAIPVAIMDDYDIQKKYLQKKGYKEFEYKNYRFFVKGDDVEDCLLLLLTPENLFEVGEFNMEEQDKQGVYKYFFELAGEEKYLYYDTTGEGSIVVKKPKRKK